MNTRYESDPAALAIADNEVAATEELRSAAHQYNAYGWPEHGIPGSPPDDAEALWELVRSGNVTTDLFLQDPTARTATLGLVRMHGQWPRANAVQDAIVGQDAALRRPPYDGILYERTDPAAQPRYTIDQGVVSVAGLTMLTRRRLLLETNLTQEELLNNTHDRITATTKIKVAKLSTFVLNIAALENEAQPAAQELRLSIICNIIANCDEELIQRILLPDHMYVRTKEDPPHRYDVEKERATMAAITYALAKIQQYGLSVDEMFQRMSEGNISHLRLPESHAAIEHEIRNPGGLLIPSTTTFYGERMLLKLERS